jgi:hypothetical protein
MLLHHCVKNHFILFIFVILFQSLFAQSGKDGSKTITTSNVIFNRYDRLDANASAGSTSITVSNINNLYASAISGTSNNPYATDALASGDLLMIIKMQGATISTTNDATYGSITAYNNTGVYELAEVQSVSGNTITLKTSLTNTFTIGGTERVQVIRIPRLSSLTITSSGILTAPAWSSSYTGGVIALEVNSDAVINGTISANGIGFRGGVFNSVTYSNLNSTYSNYVDLDDRYGGEKGESIAGHQVDYDALNGRYGRGAPANGGGGGNSHNSGGGGGANAGDVATWKGTGNPDTSTSSWKTAWDLESANFATSSSSGGGRGGYSYSLDNENALSKGPNNNAWRGDDRKNIGGLGGRPLTYSSSTLFMGGGGGAGDGNQSSGSSGANGGGIIYLSVAGSLSGNGNINANGADADNSTNDHKDALGGGGGGGAIRLNIQGTTTGISLNVNGGKGGTQNLSGSTETEGPGGGGGGGYIAVTGIPSISMNIEGGANGTTTAPSLTEFLPNGATSGGTAIKKTGETYVPIQNSVLPVTFDCFNFKTLPEDRLQINWKVYDEVNVRYYNIEESQNKASWRAVYTAWVSPNTGSSKEYTASFAQPKTATYYRIKSIDYDGSTKFSCIKTFKTDASKNITIAQSGHRIYIYHREQLVVLKLYNMLGQEVRISVEGGVAQSSFDINVLKSGMYILKVKAGNEKVAHKLLKQ